MPPEKGKGPKKSKLKPKKREPPAYKDAITRSLTFICESVSNIQRLLTYLMSESVLSIDENEEIMSEVVHSKKCLVMMQIFFRKDKHAFNVLKAALHVTFNEHLAAHLQETEDQIEAAKTGGVKLKMDGDGEEDMTENKKKLKARKGKMFTVYAADAEPGQSSESDEEDDEVEKDDIGGVFDPDDDSPSIDTVMAMFIAIDNSLRGDYFIKTEFTVNRFADLGGFSHQAAEAQFLSCRVSRRKPDKMEEQRFKVDRPIYLTKVGFYGPTNRPIAAYNIEVQLVKFKLASTSSEADDWGVAEQVQVQSPSHDDHESSGCFGGKPKKVGQCTPSGQSGGIVKPQTQAGYTETVIGRTEHLVEAANGSWIFMPFLQPIPIEPHVVYGIRFSIVGIADVAIRDPSAKLRSATVDCGEHGPVTFDFATKMTESSCQLPLLLFYKGKARLMTNLFASDRPVVFSEQDQVIAWLSKQEFLKKKGIVGVATKTLDPLGRYRIHN